MKEKLVKAVYHIELTPADHHELMMRCCYDDGNDVLNSMITGDITDWNLLEDNTHAVVHIEPNEYTVNQSLECFVSALDTMLSMHIYPENNIYWVKGEPTYWD